MDTKSFDKFIKFIKKPMPIYGIGCLLIFTLSVLAVYFARVVFYPEWLTQISATFVLFGVCMLIFTAVFLAHKFRKKNIELFMALLIFIAGLVFAFATPPNQVPDEQSHFLRAYAMAQGKLGFDYNHVYPNDVNLLIENFPVMYNNGYPAKDGNTMYNRFCDYYDDLSLGKTAENTQIIIFQTIPYIPQALGIFIANLLGFGALGAYYLGRVANLLFFSICAYYAFKMSGKFKIILFTLMAMPLTLYLAASHSNDSFLFALMALLFASVLGETFNNKKAALFTFLIAILTVTKLSYIVFIILPFAIPKDKWQLEFKGKKINKITIFALMIIVYILVSQLMGLYVSVFSNYPVIERTMVDSNPSEQFKFILSNPLRYIVVFLDTLRNNSFYLFSGGLFGWLDVDLRLISSLTPIILLFNTIKQSYNFNKSDKNISYMFFFTSILTYGVVLTGMYLSWTPVTLPQIIGIHMRYMIPAFLGFLLVIGLYFSKFINSKVKNTDYSCIITSFSFSLLASALMLVVYYLPVRAVVFVA